MRTTSLKKSRRTSSENVESSDLLMAILVLLPLQSVLICRCVAKRWNDLINSPHFLESYSIRTRNNQLCAARRPLAFVQNRIFTSKSPYLYTFTKILPVAQLKKLKMKQLPNQSGSFAHSADGLILCHNYGFHYSVLNPLNSTWVKLPPINFGLLNHAGLVCEENTEKLVPSFRVIGVLVRHVNNSPKALCIGTYSSKTGKWKTSRLDADEKLDEETSIEETFVYNGVFHWYYQTPGAHRLVVYDSKGCENYVRVMNLPLGPRFRFSLTRSLSEDVLWIGMSSSCSISFWMLPKDGNGGYSNSRTTITKDAWVLMHSVDNNSLSKEVMMLLESNGKELNKAKVAAVNHLQLDALIPAHPLVAVLSMGQNVFLYNIATKSTELVKYRGRALAASTTSGWIPFVGSRYLSTYGRLPNAY